MQTTVCDVLIPAGKSSRRLTWSSGAVGANRALQFRQPVCQLVFWTTCIEDCRQSPHCPCAYSFMVFLLQWTSPFQYQTSNLAFVPVKGSVPNWNAMG